MSVTKNFPFILYNPSPNFNVLLIKPQAKMNQSGCKPKVGEALSQNNKLCSPVGFRFKQL